MIKKADTFFQILTLVAATILFDPSTTLAQESNYNRNLNAKSDQPTLLIFSGSDWCLPCIQFHREVVINPTFTNYSNDNLNIQIADFPQHKKLTKEEVEKNEALAERFNPKGYFPHVLLLDVKGKVLTQITTNKVSAEDVIEQISLYIPSKKLKEFSKSLILMGSSFQISIVAEEGKGAKYLEDCVREIQNIESWLSSWKESSITSQLNKEASQNSVQVPNEYYELVERCLGISSLTQGAFDITFNGLGELYTFDKTERALPDKEQVDKELEHVGYDKVSLLSTNQISFTSQGVKIGFGAIGKGFAADKVKKLMQSYGVEGGIINASGDLITWGRRANGDEWKIGIPDPQASDNVILWLPFKEKAIATSGDYEKYFTNDGRRYSHIVNPKTGLPVVGSSSVSVISDSAELSDALATAVSVLGLAIGMNLINQLDGIECVFIDNNRKLHFSSGLQTYAY